MIRRLFLDHPEAVGESYTRHMRQALSFAVVMIGAGTALLLHAVIPGLFARTGSRAILILHDRMISNRRRHSPVSDYYDFVI